MIRRILDSFNNVHTSEDHVQALSLKEELSIIFPHLEFQVDGNILLWNGGDLRCPAERENALKTIALAELHFCENYDYFYKNYFKPRTDGQGDTRS